MAKRKAKFKKCKGISAANLCKKCKRFDVDNDELLVTELGYDNVRKVHTCIHLKK